MNTGTLNYRDVLPMTVRYVLWVIGIKGKAPGWVRAIEVTPPNCLHALVLNDQRSVTPFIAQIEPYSLTLANTTHEFSGPIYTGF